MSGLIVILLVMLVMLVLFIIHTSFPINNGPNVCLNCNKEYIEAEEWSYTEYSWGLRCPHCKYKFDTTP